jgi:predicted DNA-binding protein with PD1-like motif
MIYQEARSTRRVVGHLENGESVVEALNDFCRENDIRAAEIRAIGSLAEVQLASFDAEQGEFQKVFDGVGHFELLQLHGNVSTVGEETVVRLDAVIGVEGPFGQQTRAGQLREAIAETCEVFIDIYEDLEIERGPDPETGQMPIQQISRIDSTGSAEGSNNPETSIQGKGLSWEDAADQSSEETSSSETTRRESTGSESDRSEEEAERFIESGDILQHPKLGRCHVMKVEEGQYLHIRLPKGKIRKLSLSIVDIQFIEDQNGTQIFEADI